MADIVIQGMEMPLRCINCPFEMFIHNENRCRANGGKPIEFEIGNDRGTNCPLVPIPEGYGRLIDLDELMGAILATDRDIHEKSIALSFLCTCDYKILLERKEEIEDEANFEAEGGLRNDS